MMHRNPSLSLDTNRIFNLKSGENIVDVSPFIQPVVTIQRVAHIVRSATTTSNGTVTVHTCPADKDFYLTAATLNTCCDVTSDGTEITLRVIIDGVSRNIIVHEKITLTVDHQNTAITFGIPIKCDRGTTIAVNSNHTTANNRVGSTIIGYNVESLSNSGA